MRRFDFAGPVIERLRHHTLNHPEKLSCAFLAEDGTIKASHNFRSLERRVEVISHFIQQRTRPGDRAILLFPPGLSFLEACLACFHANIVAVPIYPPRNLRHWERLKHIILDADASLFLTTETHRIRFSDWAADAELAQNGYDDKLVPVDQLSIPEDATVPPRGCNPSDLAVLQYTSGSTSAPKGVMVSHANIACNLDILCDVRHVDSTSVAVTWLPHFHDMGLFEGQLMPVFAGATLYMLAPASFVQHPIRWLSAISRYKATHSAAANFAFDLCVERIPPADRTNLDLSSLQSVLNGAEPIRHETISRFAEEFSTSNFPPGAMFPGYGLAETTLLVTDSGHGMKPVTAWADPQILSTGRFKRVPKETGRPLVSCGKSAPHTEIAIVNPESGERLSANQVGEICIQGDSVAQGYWGQENASKETFNFMVGETGSRGFLRTGDLGFIDDDGEIYVCGRIKDVLIIDGVNHYPQDVEYTAQNACDSLMPDSGAAIMAEEGSQEALTIIFEVRRTARHSIDPKAIFSTVAAAVWDIHNLALDRLVLVPPGTIPKTSSGKIQRKQCAADLKSGALKILGEWPRQKAIDEKPETVTPDSRHLSGWIVERIAGILETEPAAIPIDSPFAELGISSRQAVGLSGDLAEYLGRALPANLIYDFPTIRALVGHLNRLPDETTPDHVTRHVSQHEPIAVIGMACRFPGAKTIDAFWELLDGGVSTVKSAPTGRWDTDSVKDVANRGAFLEDVDLFDAKFFGISPREAASIDPQQRLLLEIAWESFESAGYRLRDLQKIRTGIFVGICNSDYSRLQSGIETPPDIYQASGNSFSVAANRISYCFDLTGPSVAIDTACSASLVAVHQACRSLQTGDSDIAFAAGVNLILSPDVSMVLAEAQMLSMDGICRAFDKQANGYVRGEGCGGIILKTLDRAQEDGDHIMAVIEGSAVNHGGRGNGLTAPTRAGQEAVIKAALADAGAGPAQIDFIEAHGTGTPLGDPIEISALNNIFGNDPETGNPLWVGSVKTNIGHLESAAGIAGLIKSVLAMKHRTLPPQLHFNELNPEISLDGRLCIATEQASLGKPDEPVWSGISSFGFGGANAHVILRSPPVSKIDEYVQSVGELFHIPLSAADPKSLRIRAGGLADWLRAGHSDLATVAHTLAGKVEPLEYRAACIAGSRETLIENLEALADGRDETWRVGKAENLENTGVVFVFSGQGTQWIGMGQALAEEDPIFRRELDAIDDVIRKICGWSVFDALDSENLLRRQEVLQPALCALQIAIANSLIARGVEPAAVVGHSLGEIAAAACAGAITSKEAIRIALARGTAVRAVAGSGGMLATNLGFSDLSQIANRLGSGLEATVDNATGSSVASGTGAALEELRAEILKAGGYAVRLDGTIPFHHSDLSECAANLESALAKLKPQPPQRTIASTVMGALTDGLVFDASYWGRNMVQPVLFRSALADLTANGYRHFVEIAVQPALKPHIESALQDVPEKSIMTTMTKAAAGRSELLDVVATLFVDGLVDFDKVDTGVITPHIPLPPYPWRKSRHWIAEYPQAAAPAEESEKWKTAIAQTSRQANFVPLSLQLADYPDIWAALNDLAMTDMIGALTDLNGGDEMLDVKVCAASADNRFEGLIERWFEVLTTARKIKKNGGRYRVAGQFSQAQRDAALARAEEALAGIPFLFDYVRRCGDMLPEILRGNESALQTLFPDGSWETVEQLYHRWPVAQYFNNIAGQMIVALSAYRERGNPLRVLEVGAGTGGTTRTVLPLLSKDRTSYVYTDVSSYFQEPVREKLADYPNLSFEILDLEKDPVSQGFEPQSFDVIVAANAVHAVTDLRQSLSWLRHLLRDNGTLILYEITEPFIWLDSSVALIEGWGNFNDAIRNGSPLLTSAGWSEVLGDSGFGPAHIFPDSGSPANIFGQNIIVARTEGHAVQQPMPQATANADAVYRLAWHPKPLEEEPKKPGKIALNSVSPAFRESAINLASTYNVKIEESPYECGTFADRKELPDHLVLVIAPPAPAAADIEPLLLQMQETLRDLLAVDSSRRPKLWIATSGAQNETADPATSVLWGWARAAANEFPGLIAGIIDLDREASPALSAEQIIREIALGGGDQLLYRNGQRLAAMIEPDPESLAETPVEIRSDGLYLISGGVGVLGQQFARYLSRKNAGGVILLSRFAGGYAKTEAGKALINEMGQTGTPVHLISADIADKNSLWNKVLRIESETRLPVKGVIHAAGILDTAPLSNATAQTIHNTLHAKVMGAWALHDVFEEAALDFFVLFGSASSILAPPGHGPYSAANAALDALAAYRRSMDLPGTSISWGVWESSGESARNAADLLTEHSFAQIRFGDGIALFERLAAGSSPNPIILPGDQASWANAAARWMDTPVRAGLTDLINASAGGGTPSILSGGDKMETIRIDAAALMNLDPSALDPHKPLLDQGLDSLMAVALKGRIEQRFGVALPVTSMLGTTTLTDLLSVIEGVNKPVTDELDGTPGAGREVMNF